MAMEAINELILLLREERRIDIKLLTLTSLLDLTGSPEGFSVILKEKDLLLPIVNLAVDCNDPSSKTACMCLVNLSATVEGAQIILNTEQKIVSKLVIMVLDPESHAADACCMILSNMSRPLMLAELVRKSLDNDQTLDQLINAFTKVQYNKRGCNLHYLGPVFSNLSQTATFRRYLLSRDKCILQRLLPYTDYVGSVIRRGGIVGTVRNCCFEQGDHEWLLGETVDILPRLLFPLAGPEEFDDDDMDKLPPELQYLPEDKTRETDGDIRKMLLEALHQLCAMKSSRCIVREKNTYVILREYHKWEKDREIKLAAENIIDILIKTEEEIGVDNLKEVDVPDEYIPKFEEMDREYVADT